VLYKSVAHTHNTKPTKKNVSILNLVTSELNATTKTLTNQKPVHRRLRLFHGPAVGEIHGAQPLKMSLIKVNKTSVRPYSNNLQKLRWTGVATVERLKASTGDQVHGANAPYASKSVFYFIFYGSEPTNKGSFRNQQQFCVLNSKYYCNSKHGCDYKGYGFACKLPRLNLTEFEHESVNDRVIPVLQLFCSSCQEREHQGNTMRCAGCPRAFHSGCLEAGMKWTRGVWYCTSTCEESSQARRIVVDLPRKRLPLMSTPKNAKQPDQQDLNAVRQ